jgi:MFS family permease
VFWGVGADIWGRKISFNLTLFITGVFGIAAGGAPNFITLTALTAVFSVGVGGNLPVDSAVFLEFVPVSHQYLLTVLSIWWAVGQLIGSLVAWPLLGNFSCQFTTGTSVCLASQNRGWRYFQYTMGGFMMILWIIRFFFFKLYESPKYLMGRGRDQEAVAVVHEIARRNGVHSSLSVGELKEAESIDGTAATAGQNSEGNFVGTVVRQHLAKFDSNHVSPLFATRKLAYSTSLLITLWALIGLAFPLYNSFIPVYLATRGADFGDGSPNITYRNQVILSVIGLPGALIAGYMVDLPILGRRGTLAISTGRYLLLLYPQKPSIITKFHLK